MRKLTNFVQRTVCLPTCQSVLSQENSDDGDVGGARSLHPPDTIDANIIDERRGDELAALVLRGRCEDGDDKRGRPKRMQPN
jgi:hypothetical protein